MNHLINQLSRTFTVRLVLNILLWVVLCCMIYTMNVPDHHVREILFYKAISLVSLLLFSYTNNLFLIPHFLAKGRTFLYLLLAFLLMTAYAFLYSIFIQAVVHKTPEIKLYEIVLFTISGKAEWSSDAIAETTLGYAFVYSLWLFVMTMAWYMHDHARQRRVMLLAQQKQTEAELSFLKAQIHPHFLFNTLNNLYALALRKSEKSPDVILKLSSILRYLLYDSNTPTVSFEKEKEIMQAYIDIELLRLDNVRQFKFSISADEPRPIPPLLWLPVLENVFKHGTRTVADDNYVEFNFRIQRNVLTIYSKNKEKMLVKVNAEQGGIGLKNLEKRLEILYPGKHHISTVQESSYYISQVQIELPS
ncbi:MAG TPA: histidine kinase [Flavipsychrobacter sp.]|nr:histidine kinase [Flavipsychrobacter sp.]